MPVHLRISMVGVLWLLLAPSPARADVYVSPFVGVNFGGSVGTPLNAAVDDRNRVAWGVAFGGMGGGVFGAELELSYTPRFYTTDENVVTENNLLTVMPALVLGVPIGGQQGPGIRPYVTAGAGLVRRSVEFDNLASLSESDLAYVLGGGVMLFLGDAFGIRGDVRYFRNFSVDELGLSGVDFERGTFNFGRASVGAIFRF
ncbi:MAG: outer membrane protein [Vicinamibacterales bacterium]